MSRKPAPTIRNPEDRFQRDTRDVLNELSSTPLLSGVLVRDVPLSGTTARVYHNLGRPAVGFLVVDATATVNVWRDATFAASPNLCIPLVASGSATVSLWVF